MILYKYIDRAGAEGIVRNAELWASPIHEYNDPFEGLAESTYDAAKDDFIQSCQSPEMAQLLSEQHNEYNKQIDRDANRNGRRITRTEFEGVAFDNYLERGYGGNLGDFRVARRNGMGELGWGIISLSKHRSNLLLWSHYAQQHLGYMVAIDVSMWKKADCLYKVRFNSRRVPSDYSHEGPFGDEILTRKAKEWRYEGEYRIITRLNEGEIWRVSSTGKKYTPLPLEQGQLKWLCAGIKTPDDHIETMKLIIAESKFSDAKIGKATIHATDFKVDIPPELFK